MGSAYTKDYDHERNHRCRHFPTVTFVDGGAVVARADSHCEIAD